MNKLKCPNCLEPMKLTKINYLTENNDICDKWECKDCTHITVFDYRGE